MDNNRIEENFKILKVEATKENYNNIVDFIENTLEQNNCPQKIKIKILIAVDEISANIFQYSKATEFIVKIGTIEDDVYIEFMDNGIPYNPLNANEPDINKSLEQRDINPGGWGIYIVKKIMDTVKYEFENGYNKLIIQKKYIIG